MNIETKGRVLRDALVVLGVALMPEFGSTLSAQVCAPNDPCTCSSCCQYLVDQYFQCPIQQGGGYCFFTVCVGGQGGNLGASSECEFCCLAYDTNRTWSFNRKCVM